MFLQVPARMRAVVAMLVALSALVAAPAAQAGKSPGKADRTSPGVAITAPSGGASVSGTIAVTGTASDNVALARVEVTVDGATPVTAQGTSAWTSSIDTTRYAAGAHGVTARAVDTAGNASTSTVSVSVSNAAPPADTTPPTVAIAGPADGATVARQISVSGTGGDNATLAKVEIRLDGGPWQLASGTSSWSTTLDAAASADGVHVVTARATDGAGNVSSASVSVRLGDIAVTAPALAAGTIGGFAFQEHDRDGVFETTEQPLSGVYVYFHDSSGTYIGKATTDATGWYSFSGLANGTYQVQIAPISWNPLKNDWVADTTGTIFPRTMVTLAGSARTDLGTRPIARSTDPNAPISSYVGASGLTVKSYDDAVSAREVHDRLATGSLVGGEGRDVTIRFDIAQAGRTSTHALLSNGVYSDFHATSDVTWAGWLRGDGELFHEYGHAWSSYYARMVQADSSLRAYLQARGLYGDSRVGTTYPWSADEMIAEDYRQLFGTTSAKADTQMNTAIPPAKDVPGLASFLSSTFMQTRVP